MSAAVETAVFNRFREAARKRGSRDPTRAANTLVAIRAYANLSYDDLQSVSDDEIAPFLQDLRHTSVDVDHLERVRLRQAHKGVGQNGTGRPPERSRR